VTERASFRGVNVVVHDMAAAVAFYRLLGIEVADAPAPWDANHRSLGGNHVVDLDSARFAAMWDESWPPGATGMVLNFTMPGRDEVDATYAALVGAGHPGSQPPCDAFWGARYAVVEDPSGNHIGLMSPVDPARRAARPDL
jgi:uncharacterized glyoxalase superfamily protein PhnB